MVLRRFCYACDSHKKLIHFHVNLTEYHINTLIQLYYDKYYNKFKSISVCTSVT